MRTKYTTTIQTGQSRQARQDRQQIDIPVAQRLLVRPDEAAAQLGVGRSTIYELMRRGELPIVHVGRASRIPTLAIVQFVEQQAQLTMP